MLAHQVSSETGYNHTRYVGCGKSSIMKLIERFYDPENGEIILDGRQIKDLHLRELRRKIGYVGQEPVLFNSSIKDNLLYGNPTATDE